MKKASKYLWLIGIGTISILANVAGALFIVESWHSIGHWYFNTCGGIDSSGQVLLSLIITPIIAGAWAVFLIKDRADVKNSVTTCIITGIAVSFFMIVPVMWISIENDSVHIWKNLFLAFIAMLIIVMGTTTGAQIFTRYFYGDTKNSKTAIYALLLTAILSWAILVVLPQLLLIIVKQCIFKAG